MNAPDEVRDQSTRLAAQSFGTANIKKTMASRIRNLRMRMSRVMIGIVGDK